MNQERDVEKLKIELPNLRGEKLYIPFVGAIIERENESGAKQVLIQIRDKANDEKFYGFFGTP